MAKQKSLAELASMQNLYTAAPGINAYNPGQATYDVQTEAAIADYSKGRTDIYSTLGRAAVPVKQLINRFLVLADTAANTRFQAETIAGVYRNDIALTGVQRRMSDVAIQNRANISIQAAQQIVADSIAQAKPLIPQISDMVYLNVLAPAPVALTSAVQGRVDAAHHDFLMTLSTSTNRQQQAERLVPAIMGDLVASYTLMNGDMDLALKSMGVDLVALHKVYAAALAANGQDVPGQAIIDLLNADSFNSLLVLAQSIATRVLVIVAKETNSGLTVSQGG